MNNGGIIETQNCIKGNVESNLSLWISFSDQLKIYKQFAKDCIKQLFLYSKIFCFNDEII